MAEPERISPEETYREMKSGEAFLVCAYDDEKKFKAMHLEGAMSLDDFKKRLPSLSKEQEIVFYCA